MSCFRTFVQVFATPGNPSNIECSPTTISLFSFPPSVNKYSVYAIKANRNEPPPPVPTHLDNLWSRASDHLDEQHSRLSYTNDDACPALLS